MRIPRLRAKSALLLLALPGCAGASGGGPSSVSLTRAGQAVVVTESATRTRYCEFVTDLTVAASPSIDDADAVVSLRNAAGAAGGNLLHLVQEARTISRAEAYLCVE